MYIENRQARTQAYMKYFIRLIVWLYPLSWRHRYRREFDALLEDIRPGWRDFLDVLKGALEMHMTMGRLGKRVAVFGLAGALLAAALSFTLRDKYLSEALVTVPNAEGQATALESYRGELDQLVSNTLNRDSLIGIIEKQHLYERERMGEPIDAVIDKMRSNISIRVQSPTALEVSFAYPDAVRAQNATSDLLSKLIDENVRPKDATSIATILRIHASPAMPLGPIWPNRAVITGLGLGAGVFMGALVACLRRPKNQVVV
jgi:LPS O-antigen subunit length determinant protein (WzzB/FepE family)